LDRDHPAAMASWAFPQRVPGELLVSVAIVVARLRLGRAFTGNHAQEMAAMLQFLFPMSIAKKPVVADAVESTGENVEEESPDELLGCENHGLLLIVVSIVPPLEADLPVVDIHDPMVGNRDTVRVAPDVIHHLLGPAKGGLA
jgi:hypothetical protein